MLADFFVIFCLPPKKTQGKEIKQGVFPEAETS